MWTTPEPSHGSPSSRGLQTRAYLNLIASPASVSTGGRCAASINPGGAADGTFAADTDVSAIPPATPAVIPAAPPASDRRLGRRMGFLLVGIPPTVRGQLGRVRYVSATGVTNPS